MTGIDLGQIAAIGGPFSAVAVLVTILVQSFLAIRKDKREGGTQDISNSGAMADSAKKVMDLVTEATNRINDRLIEVEAHGRKLAAKNQELEQHINQQDDVIARLRRDKDFLKEDLDRANRKIEELEKRYGRSA